MKHPTSATCSAQSRKSYYPFGLIKDIFGTGASGKFQFSGNEHESMNGLNMHDFHFRWYDQELGRFTTMDPLAENHYNTSPYAYCGNNPINRIDPRGLDWYWNNGNIDDITWFEGDEDREGFDYHSPTTTGMDEDYYYYYMADGSIEKERRKEAEIIGYGNSWGGFGLWPENNYDYGDDDGGTGSSSSGSWSSVKDDILNGAGGLGAGVKQTDGTFALSKQGKPYIRHYAVSPKTGRGWGGGSRAKITTHSMVKLGKSISRGAFGVSIGIGIYDTAYGIKEDGGFGYNAQMAAAETAGGMLGSWGGAAGGAAIGSLFFPPIGTIVGGVIGGIAVGWGGAELGKSAVDWFYGY